MQLELFLGGFFGALSGALLILIGVLAAIFVFGKKEISQPKKEEILEKYVEGHLVDNFDVLLPGWKIYDNVSEETIIKENHKPLGVQYKIKNNRIDILCVDPKGDLVILELKRSKAQDRVISQVDRYIIYVEKHIAAPGQKVKGIIIAASFDNQLLDMVARRSNISIWTFDWNLKLNKRPLPNNMQPNQVV